MPKRFGFGTTPARFARFPLLTQEGIVLSLQIHTLTLKFRAAGLIKTRGAVDG